MTQARLLGGRYQVGELLGYGGMAEVNRGRDLRLGRDVAIKMLRTDLARDDTFQLRFRREAQNAASLNHPAIVAVYDTGEERAATGEALPFIVMEFVNGRTLKEVLAAEGRLMPRRALEITAEISAALDFSHRHGIIHRDIKPGNVMLTQTGQVKVMDFGIARALASGASTMTQTSAVIGTAQYLSPEQARGEAVDARSDVYATGCVLYELLCGHPPFVGDSPVSVAYQHVREDPKAPSQSNRDVSPAIDAIVLKALAKNPMNRYQSAGEMRADVLRAAAGRPVYAEPVMRDSERTQASRSGPGGPRGVPARVGDARRRRTSGWAIMALTALAVLAVVALVAGLIVSQQPEQETVPNLVNMTNLDAQRLLHQRKLTPDPQATAQPGCTPNQVISQNTEALTKADAGSKITYLWCTGPGQTVIPTIVIGLSTANATQTLEALHLRVTVTQVDSVNPVDTVVETNPPAGQAVPGGSEVQLKVSKGNLKAVPDVSTKGYSEAQARAVLQNQGFFTVESTTQSTLDPTKAGQVIDQDPPANTPKDPTKTKILIIIGRYDGPPISPTPTVSPT
jgi:beta-lactam-binding protein with PASTA domain/predicted Ser/Thr protein kinase